MLDELKSRARDFLAKSEAPLSIRPERKDTGIVFDPTNVAQYARNGYGRIAELLGNGGPTWSGEAISRHSALRLSAVYACNKIISSPVGFLPFKLRRRVGSRVEDAIDHPMYAAMLYAPNSDETAQTFWELRTSHCLLEGNGYAQIVRRSGTGTAIELRNLLPENVQPHRERDGQKRLVYEVKEANQPNRYYPVQPGKPQDIYHQRGIGWDGLRGYSVIAHARQSLGTIMAQERYVGTFFGNGGRGPFTLQMEKEFETDQEFDKFAADFRNTYRDPHKAVILENGIKYVPIGSSAADAQLNESRQQAIAEACRWFNVSPHLAGDLSRATFGNIESLAEQFVRFTLMEHLTRRSQESWRCILTPEEQQQGYFFDNDIAALSKSDFQALIMGHAQLLQNGVECINETRQVFGMNPIAGGDEHYVQVNMAPIGTDPVKGSGSRVRIGAPEV